jgi:ribosome-interacting GTPase 1
MRKELNHIKAVNAYKAISDEKTVDKLIDAVSDADHNAIATIIANECKKAVAEAEAKWLKDRPRVNAGQYSSMTREQIMSIKDREERTKAIAMNQGLFN